MNEDARDGNSPTGQALGNLALLVAAPLTIAGGLYGGYRLSKGAWNMTKGARGKIAETAENVVNKAKTAKEIRDISKDIKASNPEDAFMKNELKDLAKDQQMNEKYIKQNNPEIKQEELKERARQNTKHNIENKQLLSEVDVTGDLDGIFAEQSGFEGMDMPKGYAEYATGDSHGMATSGGAPEAEKSYQDHVSEYHDRVANQRKNDPNSKLNNNNILVDMDKEGNVTGHQQAGDQMGFFDADYGAAEQKAKDLKEQAHQNVMERNSTFSDPNAKVLKRGQYDAPIGPGQHLHDYASPIGPKPYEGISPTGNIVETHAPDEIDYTVKKTPYEMQQEQAARKKSQAEKELLNKPRTTDFYNQESMLPEDDFADVLQSKPKTSRGEWQGPMPQSKPAYGPSPLTDASNSAFNGDQFDSAGFAISDSKARTKKLEQINNNIRGNQLAGQSVFNESKLNDQGFAVGNGSAFNNSRLGSDGNVLPMNPNAYSSPIGPEAAPKSKGNSNGGGKKNNRKKK